MKVSVALAFEEGDETSGEYVLTFADGSTQVLTQVISQIVVDLAAFTPAAGSAVHDVLLPEDE
jgi:hypothetical protein